MPDEEMTISRGELLALTAEIVASHAGHNAVPRAGLPSLIQSVFDSLSGLAEVEPEVAPMPAVPIRRSVTEDHIVCLEDGKRLKTLKRHLETAHGMTPEAYRAKWGLKPDYPMVARSYAATRQALAKQIGLGRKSSAPPPPAPAPEPKPKRRRKTAA
jgi:predicted transcriptional regulator